MVVTSLDRLARSVADLSAIPPISRPAMCC
ncbi:hypothetical protein [Rhodococcus sp. IEGM 1307]